MLRSIFCESSDAYILVSATLTVPITSPAGAAANNRKNTIIKDCTLFANCISKINNTQIDNAQDIDIVIPMYSLREYSDNYSEISGSF